MKSSRSNYKSDDMSVNDRCTTHQQFRVELGDDMRVPTTVFDVAKMPAVSAAPKKNRGITKKRTARPGRSVKRKNTHRKYDDISKYNDRCRSDSFSLDSAGNSEAGSSPGRSSGYSTPDHDQEIYFFEDNPFNEIACVTETRDDAELELYSAVSAIIEENGQTYHEL